MFTNHSLVFLDEYCWNSMGRLDGGGKKGGVESGGVGRRRWKEKEPIFFVPDKNKAKNQRM